MPSKKEMSKFMKNFSERAQLSYTEAMRIKDAFVQALRKEAMEHKVIIDGLGTFYTGHRRATKRKTPLVNQDGPVVVNIPSYSHLAFKAAKCNRKYDSPEAEGGTFESVIRYDTDGSYTVPDAKES